MAIQAKFLLLISVLIVLISGPARAARPHPRKPRNSIITPG